MLDSRLASCTCPSLAHQLHYVVRANYYVAVTHETTGAEDHVKSGLTYLLIFYSYIDSLLHSLLSESIINSLNVTEDSKG